MSEHITLERAEYLLLHDDRYLDAFLHRDLDALRLSTPDAARLLSRDSGDVMWAYRRKQEEVRDRLQPHLGAAFCHWHRYMPDDTCSRALMALFLRSADHEDVWSGRAHLVQAFRRFAERTAIFPADVLQLAA